jgi:hypothetical protein
MSKSETSRRLALLFSFGVVLLAFFGCGTSPFLPPAEVAHVSFDYRHSPAVTVKKAWFERHDGDLGLTGYVSAAADSVDTTQTRLEITFKDSTGGVLLTLQAGFEPEQIPRHVRLRGGNAWFRIPVPAPPGNFARVTVAAREK